MKVISLITEGKLNMLPMGKKELISKLTIEELIKFHKEKYIFSNIAIMIVGGVDIIKTEKELCKLFGEKMIGDSKTENCKNQVVKYKKSEVIKVENNREPFNKVNVYYRFRANEISIKDRLIKYFFDRMLEARLKKEFSSRNIELIDVICIDKKI